MNKITLCVAIAAFVGVMVLSVITNQRIGSIQEDINRIDCQVEIVALKMAEMRDGTITAGNPATPCNEFGL